MNAQAAAQLAGLVVAATGGDGHGDHGINWWVVGSTITNFILFFGFLYVKLKPMVGNALSERRMDMARRLEEAQQKQKEAEAKLAEYKEKLVHLEDEVKRVVESYEAEARADSEKMKQETERAIQRLERESEFTIKQEMRKAEDLIRERAVTATLEAAQKLIEERITDADRRRLVDQYITKIEEGAPGA